MKYYAVKKGRKPGIYQSWAECEAQILHVPGAIYQAFPNKKQAQAFLLNTASQTSISNPVLNNKQNAVAYSDGSYLKSDCTYSYGAVVLWNNKEFHFSKRFQDFDQSSMWNVSGELEGAKRVMLFAYQNKIKHLRLYHDYEGIAKWANHQWEAKNAKTIAYLSFCKKIKERVNVTFVWVKGHSGDKYNDLADRLAAEARFEEYAKEV